MFHWLGQSISRFWPAWFGGWLVILVVAGWAAPAWQSVAIDEDDALLGSYAPSLRAERVFRQAFPDELAASNIVIVLHRQGSHGQFFEADKKYISDVLEPALRKAAGMADRPPATVDESPFSDKPAAARTSGPVLRLHTPNAPGIGELLISHDREAMLVAMELSSNFMSPTNVPIIAAVQKALADLETNGTKPAGMNLNMTGSAVIGHDHREAEVHGARSTEKLTIGLVIVLLLLIYRSPVLALIPLLTVAVAVKLSISILAMMARAGWIGLFPGIQIYITILAYGAGVDFTLFLIARYREHLNSGEDINHAVSSAVSNVGATITASAFTVICGLGTLAFAEFGKFREAGIGIALSLSIVWLAALTLSPTLLELAGKWTFWPRRLYETTIRKQAKVDDPGDPCAPVRSFSFRNGWASVVQLIASRPGWVLSVTTALMLPFAIAGLVWQDRVSYNLVGNLPASAPSVAGTNALNAHFPSGILGQVSVLAINPKLDFTKSDGRDLIQRLTQDIHSRRQEFELSDARSLTSPLGINTARLAPTVAPDALESAALDNYVSSMGERGGPAMRLDFVFQNAPFEESTVRALTRLESFLQNSLPEGTELFTFGTAATVRDLQAVMQRDRGRIERYVLLSVFIVLILLLRQLIVPIYLLLSVLLSYFATLGVTYMVFWALASGDFVGLDWKVSVFLFAILIAVGEDYNIFLVARVDEEQAKHGPVRGVIEALERTGPIISSCGIIMAGTFASLIAGTLLEMRQLGFALAFGVLLDTFVVRPVLVPAFLILVNRWSNQQKGQSDEVLLPLTAR